MQYSWGVETVSFFFVLVAIALKAIYFFWESIVIFFWVFHPFVATFMFFWGFACKRNRGKWMNPNPPPPFGSRVASLPDLPPPGPPKVTVTHPTDKDSVVVTVPGSASMKHVKEALAWKLSWVVQNLKAVSYCRMIFIFMRMTIIAFILCKHTEKYLHVSIHIWILQFVQVIYVLHST